MSSRAQNPERKPPEGRHHFHPPDPADAVDTPVGAHDAAQPSGPRPPRPWYLQIAGQWPMFLTLLGVAAGLLVVTLSYWRRGSTMIGLTILGAAVLRLLPDNVVGLLKVRSRTVDVALLALMGVGILVLAWVISPTRK